MNDFGLPMVIGVGAFVVVLVIAWMIDQAGEWLNALDHELDEMEDVLNNPKATRWEVTRVLARLHYLDQRIIARKDRRRKLAQMGWDREGGGL